MKPISIFHGRIGRGIVAAVAMLAAVGTTAACGSTGASSAKSSDLSGTLNILVSSADASDAAFKQVNKAFEAKYPHVTVKFSSVPNDSYPATKASRLSAGTLDIFVLKNFVEVPSYAKDSTSDDTLMAQSGGIVDLTNESFMKHYSASVLKAQAIGGKQYAVPTGLSYSTGIYYNKKIFEQNGLKAPTTWSELQSVMSTLKSKGITPFGIGGKDTWPAGLVMLGSVASEYPTLADKQKLAKNLWTQKVSLTDTKTEGILEKTQTIFNNAQQNFSGAGYDDLPAAFARGDFAMMPDGTWNEPTIDSAIKGAFDFGYIPFPASDNASDNSLLDGKIELQLGIASATKNKDAALKWMEFFSEKSTYTKFAKTAGFSSSQPDVATSSFLKSISQYTQKYEPAWDQVWVANNKAGEDAVYPFNYPALSPLGTKTAKSAAASSESAWSAAF
ncbi:MAG: extracellular solute-binding protein [Bifidobacterium aquikefiri]|uniref:Bacterial extracellular solute-binding protein n=1 Tax=Bifidobacterium aquikefiri TaxID=1653207 RepID=A0A261GAE4_9BIFI|nr:extracellular solute-binding protein [Bifidobacterium aquikefiri]OZG68384.1 Bacterial extracellular solute-binding protein [Bifidobacterium aquikefiri]